MQKSYEKRREVRYPIELPIRTDFGEAVSKDISFSGIYFTTNKLFAAGDTYKFDFELKFAATGKPIHLDCQGQVLRVDRLDTEYGVASTIVDMAYQS